MLSLQFFRDQAVTGGVVQMVEDAAEARCAPGGRKQIAKAKGTNMEILRDEYLDYMTFQAAPRPLFVELFDQLIGLDKEWQARTL
jgi:hypothetical protein